jgi:hypothetical protein
MPEVRQAAAQIRTERTAILVVSGTGTTFAKITPAAPSLGGSFAMRT